MSLARALGEWRRAIGAAHVVTDSDALAAAESATYLTSQRIPAIVRPRNRAEVQACLRIANRFRVPVRDASVLLDLGRMNRIVAFDERLACVTIEPGVTFRQLHRFLRARRSRLRTNPTGSTPDSSPLANALERGLGRGPLPDRFANLCGFEVVLPTGACVRTGFARLPGARAAALHRWGVGPCVDGLFSQSNLGVVTQATLWLSPIPELADLLAATLARGADLGRLVDALRPVCDRISFRGEQEIGEADWEEIHRPTSAANVASVDWRKRARPPHRMDPDRDSCGEIWCAPVVPLRGRDVAQATRILERTAAEARLEPMIAVTILDGRAAYILAGLYFDRSVPGEDARAHQWARKAINSLAPHGYYPYRLGVHSMRLLPPARPDDAAFRRALKRALDPSGILSPGRYEAAPAARAMERTA